MPICIVCDSCGFILYRGKELKSIEDVLRRWDYRCPCCLSKLEKDIRKIHDSNPNWCEVKTLVKIREL